MPKQPLEAFCKKAVLKNFVKFIEKHLCWSLLFSKVAGLTSPIRVFLCEFCEIFKKTYFVEHLRKTAFT